MKAKICDVKTNAHVIWDGRLTLFIDRNNVSLISDNVFDTLQALGWDFGDRPRIMDIMMKFCKQRGGINEICDTCDIRFQCFTGEKL